jgi:chromosome partitioning protein
MARIMAVANQKGGVGKSTTVHNLGAALVERNQRVLLIDLDPQAALTASVGLDPYKLEHSTSQLLLSDDKSLRQIIHPLGQGLWLLPAGMNLTSAEFKLATASDRSLRLKQALARETPNVDIILIDTPPSLGLITINALAAARQLLVPVSCQYLALRGVRALLETTRLIFERLNPDLRLLGMLPTMYQAESEHSQQVVRELRRVFGDRVLDSIIEYDEAVAMAPAARQSVLRFRPESPAAISYRRLADEILHY